jgi:TolA-binding protein
MDVSGKLAEKRCGEEAEREGATIRREKMASAVAKAQSNATSAWNGMLADLEACTKLDYDDRAPCIDAVENWITVASKMEVTLPAGQEMVETDCGLKQTVFDVISQKVAVDELPDAKAMLIQLNVRVTDQLNVRVSDQLDVVVEHLLAGRSSIARDLLQRLLADNIGAPELDEVRYRLAESHFNEKNWGGAARAFQEVVEKHSNSQWAPWAMLRQGECFVAMGQHKNAMLFYQDLEYKYPKSEAAKHARSRMTKPLTNEDGKW